MAASTSKVEDDPKQLAEAQNLWGSFMTTTKWSIIVIALILIGLALAFVPAGA